MLKKKHEEAKELLVRALVNNNNLLMPNHPVYEQNISSLYSFSPHIIHNSFFWFYMSVNYVEAL